MKSIFLKELKLSRKALIIWSVIMFLTAAFGMVEFASLKENLEVLVMGVSGIPRIVRIFFGVDAIPIDTPLGVYACMYYFFTIIAFCFAVYTGVFIIARDERFKTSEFLYTKPYTRKTILVAKMLVSVVNMVIMAIVTIVGSLLFLVPLFPEANLAPIAFATTLGMLLTMFVFLAIGMLCAVIARNYRNGLLQSFIVLIAAFVVSMAIEFSGNVNFLGFLSPVRWFNVKSVAENGIGALYVLLMLAIVAVATWFTFRLHKQRDLYL